MKIRKLKYSNIKQLYKIYSTLINIPARYHNLEKLKKEKNKYIDFINKTIISFIVDHPFYDYLVKLSSEKIFFQAP